MNQGILTVIRVGWMARHIATTAVVAWSVTSEIPIARVRADVPEFEVASVTLNKSGDAGEGSGRIRIQTSPGTLTMRNVTLMSCLRWANDLHDYQISGPSSLGVDRYDITARAGSPVGDDQLKLMLRALLADRFRLTSHRETRERQVYMLTIARSGPRLRAADESGPGVTRPKVRATMSELAGVLSGPMMAPVVDRTGLDGRYDFVLDMSEFMPAGASKTGVDIPGVVMTAVQEQLGLQLKPGQARIEFLVVDRVERPTQD